MPRVGLEPRAPSIQLLKAFRALDRSATLIVGVNFRFPLKAGNVFSR